MSNKDTGMISHVLIPSLLQPGLLCDAVLLGGGDRDHCPDAATKQNGGRRAGWPEGIQVLNGGVFNRTVVDLLDHEQFRGLRSDQGLLRYRGTLLQIATHTRHTLANRTADLVGYVGSSSGGRRVADILYWTSASACTFK